MSFTQELKKHALSACDLDFIGIADPAALDGEPEGYRPRDLLPGAAAVVVFGRRLPNGSVQSAFRRYEDQNIPAYSSYAAYCGDLAPNLNLLFNTFDLCEHIERVFGCTAMPLPSGPLQNGHPLPTKVPMMAGPHKGGLPMNIEKAAVAAGLGEFGWSGRFLTAEYGPRVQLGALLTNMELDVDRAYDGPSICRGERCQECVRQCPTDALPAVGQGDALDVSVPGREGRVSPLRFNRCLVAACGLRKEFGGPGDYVDHCDPSEEELAHAFEAMPINSIDGVDHYPKWRCEKCLVYCPAGNWDAAFRKTGLSSL